MTIPALFLLPALLTAATPTPALTAASEAAAPSVARQGAGSIRRVDPCDGLGALEEDTACGDGPLCSRRDRVELACEMRDAIEKRYVFFPVKGRLLARAGGEPFDSRRHLDSCVEAERAIAHEEDPL